MFTKYYFLMIFKEGFELFLSILQLSIFQIYFSILKCLKVDQSDPTSQP